MTNSTSFFTSCIYVLCICTVYMYCTCECFTAVSTGETALMCICTALANTTLPVPTSKTALKCICNALANTLPVPIPVRQPLSVYALHLQVLGGLKMYMYCICKYLTGTYRWSSRRVNIYCNWSYLIDGYLPVRQPRRVHVPCPSEQKHWLQLSVQVEPWVHWMESFGKMSKSAVKRGSVKILNS